MTEAEKNERIKAVEEEMAKLQKELEDIRNTKVRDWDVGVWDKVPLRKKYEFDIPADICAVVPFNDKLDKLTKLMKFKFCYDYNYTPDWGDLSDHKWLVYFNTKSGKYEIDSVMTRDRLSTVYFSSAEIAQKCADWFNAGCPEE